MEGPMKAGGWLREFHQKMNKKKKRTENLTCPYTTEEFPCPPWTNMGSLQVLQFRPTIQNT